MQLRAPAGTHSSAVSSSGLRAAAMDAGAIGVRGSRGADHESLPPDLHFPKPVWEPGCRGSARGERGGSAPQKQKPAELADAASGPRDKLILQLTTPAKP